MLNKPFGMLRDINDYSKWYEEKFVQTYTRNKEKSNSQIVQYPFVRKLGRLTTVSGYEIRNLPLFKGAGGNILSVLKNGRWMLPLRLIPNWSVVVNQEILDIFHPLEASCKPEIEIYPFGMVYYQLRSYFEFENGIELNELINLLRILEEKQLFSSNGRNFTPPEIIKEFHKTILKDIILNQQLNPIDQKFSDLHRILTIDKMEGTLHPQNNKNELVGLIERTTQWDRLDQNYVDNRVNNWMPGIYDGQFFLFHPSCSIMSPMNIAKDPKYNSYIRKRIRRHFSSLIEFATIQSQFSKMITQELQALLEQADKIQEKKDQLNNLVSKLDDIGWIKSNWQWEFRGGHKEFYDKIKRRIGLEKNLEGTIEKLKEAREQLFPERIVTEINIDGNGNVLTIGNDNVITVMNPKFKGTDKEEIGKGIALLRGQIMNLDLPEKIKNRLVRSTENLEDETLDNEPDVEAIGNEFKSVKDELEKNGFQYDANKGWGQKLKEIAKGIVKFAPTILPIIAKFL